MGTVQEFVILRNRQSIAYILGHKFSLKFVFLLIILSIPYNMAGEGYLIKIKLCVTQKLFIAIHENRLN